jgi:hypothetical protein
MLSGSIGCKAGTLNAQRVEQRFLIDSFKAFQVYRRFFILKINY